MQNYLVRLESEVFKTFRCQKAANSLDIDVEKKSVHELKITADINSKYNVGLIVGASGSGKTTLAKQIYGENCFNSDLKQDLPIIEQLPKELSYDECAAVLSGIGLTSVPCWIRPVYTLSNGQKARAEAALMMSKNKNFTVIDEWTSVVDRTVAKVMSHCVQKHARKQDKQVVLLSCHYDVIEWLNPDWIIDCNTQTYTDRRLLRPEERKRNERLEFTIREVSPKTWKNFSKYHYLNENLPAGFQLHYGIFSGDNQIGYVNYVNYVPHTNKLNPMILHFNRLVIHPDFAGLGLGIYFLNETAKLLKDKYKIMGKFSSQPIFKSLIKSKNWKLKNVKTQLGKMQKGENMQRNSGFRENVKTYSFEFIND